MAELFDFHFTNPGGFLIAFVPGLFNLGLLVYVLLKLPRNRMTNIFALFTFSLACWQINDSIGRISRTAELTDIWDCIFSATWILVGPLGLHFALLYSRVVTGRNIRAIAAFVYGPGFVFMGLYQAHIFPHPFVRTGLWGWVNYHDRYTVDIIMVSWLSLLVLLATSILIRHTWTVRKDRMSFYQSLLITAGIAIVTLTGVFMQVVFPLAFHIPPVPVTSTIMTLFTLTTVIALRKFNLFSVSDLISNEAIIESLPMIVISISPTKRINYLNAFTESKLSVSKEKLKQTPIDQLFQHESSADELNFQTAWQRALEGKEMKDVESSLVTPGGVIHVLVTANPIINNKELQGALLTMRDITEIKKTHQKVAASESQLKIAQRLAKIGSWEWDIKTDSIRWSDELYRIFGLQPTKTSVNYETYLASLHPEDKDYVNSVITQAYQDKKPFSFYHRLIRQSDQQMVILQSRGSVSTDQHGLPLRMHGTAQDVTEMIRNEERLERKNKELQKINAELDRFVYSVSHDLRSPLTSMLGLILLAEEEITSAEARHYFELLKSSAQKLDKFIRDILDYSRNTRTDTETDIIDLQELVTDIASQYQSQKSVAIRLNIPDQLVLQSDRTRIAMILNNLISNGVRYARKSTLDSFVEIKARREESYVVIEIRDNGLGIPAEIQPRVFDMFFRGSKESEGSGLGLYIVKEALEKLHGTIEMKSKEGEGSVFTIKIPNLAP